MNLNGNANIPAARVTVEQFTHGGKYPGCYCHTTALGKLTFIIFKITDVLRDNFKSKLLFDIDEFITAVFRISQITLEYSLTITRQQ